MFIAGLGTILFGLIMGWISYRIMRLRTTPATLTDLYALLAIISGAVIVALLRDSVLFGLYALGLAIGFFGYLASDTGLSGLQKLMPRRSAQLTPPASTPAPSTDPLATDVPTEQARTTPPKRNQVKEPKSTESL